MGSSSSSDQVAGYRYSFDIHMGLGMPLDEICAIRASGKSAWSGSITTNGQVRINAPKLFGGDKGEGGLDGTLDVMFGDEDQVVVPKLASMLGGLVPAFRGITTAFYSGLITSVNPYPKTWEILRRGGNRLWDSDGAWYAAKQFIWLADNQIKAMNPAHILYLMYTGKRFRGLARSRMDDAAWRAAADTLYSEGLGLCLEWKRSDSFRSFRDTVLAHISAEVYVDRRSGLITIRLLRNDYDAATLPLFDEDSGLIQITQEETSSNGSDTVPSQLLVKYEDAITGEMRTVRAVNSAVAARDGGQSVEEVEYVGAPTAEIAARLCQRDLTIKSSGLRRFKVILDRRARDLSPGQAFRVRSLKRGLEAVVVRVGRFEDGTLTDGRITVTALEDRFALPLTSFVAVPPAGWEPPDRTPRTVTTRRIFELPYRELAGSIDPANLQLLDPTMAWLVAVAEAPTSLSLSFNLTSRVGSAEFVDRGTGTWCPTGLLVAAMPLEAGPTSVMITSASGVEDIRVGMAGLLDDEIVRVDAVDPTTGALTLARGCADTVPMSHPAGARLWIYDTFESVDNTEYTQGTTVAARLLTNTSTGQLDPALAVVDQLALQGRQGRPYPPGKMLIGGAAYPASVVGDVVLTFAHRDRLQQADQLIDTTVDSIGPESGVKYSARLLRTDSGAVLAVQDGIAAPSITLATTYAGQVTVELWSTRGSTASLQRHRWTFNHSNPAP
ncbi:phage tail protein [Pseudomonas sp. ZM23]|uniref:Phage tail protein n=1 Tax=Pseudomonas triclosanedens TaxID=2961893 RepID=A0ABY6ZVS1_9PSED|nr:phage tail protein [Pseudomonas triclosanedens]MCP8465182.1 phage tail protein [Pseudomonas triclosanedens]MCP8470878.1 phage tail protein [Pseudomonas triclosanedens]MCP8476553.1 phage tail protein [Pseudomonas triclosanedens]WAI49062.1 phage tail protein [Pseudomonas triclosanedens]